jgi:hypothetical protein
VSIKASVVIVTYRRLERIPEILAAWLAQTSDVWLCDCSLHGVKVVPPGTKIARFRPDPGNKVRHAVALLTQGDIVIKADDDILPLPGLVQDFITWHEKLGPCVTGIHGRTFQGPDYYLNTTMHAGHMIKEPMKVDFVGIITCANRQFLPMDLRDCGTDIEDLYWHNHCYPKAPKFVIPTAAYNNKLPESRDAGRLCADKPGRMVRRAFYTKCWTENYR